MFECDIEGETPSEDDHFLGPLGACALLFALNISPSHVLIPLGFAGGKKSLSFIFDSTDYWLGG